ncbi:MAG: hypothetical protein J6C96_10835 [Oscillospiraceae bacterium]|nr:hypothetical protein [Oscillospiraceae bacterium]
MKFNQQNMDEAFAAMLLPGESCIASVYCVFKRTDFFAGVGTRNVLPGFAACTDRGRLLTARFPSLLYFLCDCEKSAFEMSFIKKLKIHKNIFRQYLIEAVFPTERKDFKLKFQVAPKVLGESFPNQQQELEEMLSVLSRYEI